MERPSDRPTTGASARGRRGENECSLPKEGVLTDTNEGEKRLMINKKKIIVLHITEKMETKEKNASWYIKKGNTVSDITEKNEEKDCA